MKYISLDKQGNCDFNWKSYRKYMDSIRREIPSPIAAFFQQNFHDESFAFLLSHANGTLEFVDDGGDGIVFSHAKVTSTTLEKVGHEIWLTPDPIYAEELTLLSSKRFLWSIVFADPPHTHLSIEFENLAHIRRGSKSEKKPDGGVDESFRFYGELDGNDIGTEAHDKAENAYKIQLLELKEKLDWSIYQIFFENMLRYSSPRHIVDYGCGAVDICFSNEISLSFTRASLLTVPDNAILLDTDCSRVKLLRWSEPPCWFFEELRPVEDDDKFYLIAKINSDTVSLTFGTINLGQDR